MVIAGTEGKQRSADSYFCRLHANTFFSGCDNTNKIAGGVPCAPHWREYRPLVYAGGRCRQAGNPLSGAGIVTGMIGGSLAGELAGKAIKLGETG